MKKSASATAVPALEAASAPAKKTETMKKSKSVSFRMDLIEDIPYRPPSVGAESGSDSNQPLEWEEWYLKNAKDIAQGTLEPEPKEDLVAPPRFVECVRCIRCGAKVVAVLRQPLDFLFNYTLPNLDSASWENWYLFNYVISIIYLLVFTSVVYFGLTTFLCLINPDDPIRFFGLCFLAMALNLGDLFLSIKLTQQGLGFMVLSVLLGHNIISLLVGLPLPWLFHDLIHSDTIFVPSTISTLFFWASSATVLLLFVLVWFGGRWKLTTVKGGMLTMAYITYLAYAIIISIE
jgi:hypothetical protein